jgi:hypothetical protein
VFLIAISSIIIPLIWFIGNKIPVGWGEDGIYWIVPSSWILPSMLSTWCGYSLGEPNGALMSISLYVFRCFFELFFANVAIEQFFLFSFLFFVSLWFMYKSLLELSCSRVSSVISSFYYLFNNLTVAYYIQPLRYTQVFLAPFSSLLLYVTIKGIKKQKTEYSFEFGFITAFFSIVFNGMFVLPFLLFIIFLFIYQMICYCLSKEFNRLKNLFFFFLKCMSVSVLFNLWWILPISFVLLSSFEDFYIGAKVFNPMEIGKIISQKSSFIDMSSSLGLPVLMLLSSSLLWRKVRHKLLFPAIFFSFLSSLILRMALSNPFPINLLISCIYTVEPFRTIFRDPQKFNIILLISTSIILGWSIDGALQLRNVTRRIRPYLAILCLFFIFISSSIYPLISANVFTGSPSGSARSEIPEYYKQLGAVLPNLRFRRVLVLPLRTADRVLFNWSYGFYGVDRSEVLFRANTISNLKFLVRDQDKLIFILFVNASYLDENSLCNAFQLLDVEYIVIQRDVNTDAFPHLDIPELARCASNCSRCIIFLGRLNQLCIYRVMKIEKN